MPASRVAALEFRCLRASTGNIFDRAQLADSLDELAPALEVLESTEERPESLDGLADIIKWCEDSLEVLRV